MEEVKVLEQEDFKFEGFIYCTTHLVHWYLNRPMVWTTGWKDRGLEIGIWDQQGYCYKEYVHCGGDLSITSTFVVPSVNTIAGAKIY